jgi:N-acyl-D-aspartate/D-glutamate deacylase
VARLYDLVFTSTRRYDTFEAGVGHRVDDTSGPWYRGQVAGHGDTIVAVGPMVDDRAARVIDAAGLVVWPGFIDIHTYPRPRPL